MFRTLALPTLLRPSCAVCSLAPGPLCPDCEADFFPASRLRCVVCAIPLQGADAICGRCLASRPHFERTIALADYAPPVDGMVTALKFGARLDLASMFGRLLARRAPPEQGAIVVAVPLAFERMSERGFNQSVQIARAYCADTGACLATDIVRRVRHAQPQQVLSLDERRRNIRGAFAASGDIDGRELLVVDDVMTSGSTMDEIARVLAAAGAARIRALVVARTP
ncbi:MAG: ComF family protein [Burkholderiaceae bacterium]